MADIFDSQADTGGNAFTNPMNPANMNPGWGINPSLLTPGYSAPYRPAYQGAQPYQFGRMTVPQAVRSSMPWSADPIWGNPLDHQSPAADAMSNRPMDGGMSFMQNWAVPGAALFASMKAANRPASTYAHTYAQALASGRTAAQASAMASGAQAAGMGIKSGGFFSNMLDYKGLTAPGAFGVNAGARFGAGVASGLGAGVETTSMITRAAAGIGGVAANFAMSAAVYNGALYAADKGVFSPYINTRRGAENLRSNFQGVTFGDAVGNVASGGGLNRREATGMAQQLSSQGIRDLTFSTGQYTQIADMAGRSGLLDNTKAGDITKKVKDISEQIKMILTISKDPSIRNAIEELSKLNLAGASVRGGVTSTAAGAYSQMGRLASAAGTSVQRLMSETGAQGQYIYQANGMTPYLGQLAAGASMASFSAANRMGLIGEGQLARMGGLDGAVQNSLTGQVNASQSMYNKMALYNSFTGKSGSARAGPGQSLSGVMSAFGNSLASDPLGVMGATMLHGRAMAGNQLTQRGGLGIQDQLMSIAGPMGLVNADGTLDAHRAAPLLGMLGMNDDQANAYLTEMRVASDPRTVRAKIKGYERVNQEQERQYISQNAMYGGVLGTAYGKALRGGRSIVDTVKSGIADPLTSMGAFMGDQIAGGLDALQYGSTVDRNRMGRGDGYFLNGESGPANLIDGSYGDHLRGLEGQEKGFRLTNRYSSAVQTINKMAVDNNMDAINFLRTKNLETFKTLIGNNRGEFGDTVSDFFTKGGDSLDRATRMIEYSQQHVSKVKTSSEMGPAQDIERIKKMTGGDTSAIDSLDAIGRAHMIVKKSQNDPYGAAEDIKRLSPDDPLRKIIGDSTGSAAIAKLSAFQAQAGENGMLFGGLTASREGLTLASAKKNPGLIQDKALRSRFSSAGSDDERSRVLLEYTRKLTGDNFGKKLSGISSYGLEDQIGRVQAAGGYDTSTSDAYKQAAGNKINFSSMEGFIEALNAPIKTFADATKVFADAVNGSKEPQFKSLWGNQKNQDTSGAKTNR